MSSIKLIISLLCLTSTFCSSQSTSLRGSTLPLDILSSITSFLKPKDQAAFITLSSKDLNHSFIIQALETSKHNFSRPQSLQIVRFAKVISEAMHAERPIYPITLTFHQDDVPSLKNLDILSVEFRLSSSRDPHGWSLKPNSREQQTSRVR